MSTDRSRQRGISLVELILAIVVLSVGLVGLLGTTVFAVRSSADPMLRKQALAVAESMLNEILLKDFANPTGGFTGAATPSNRPLFDDVMDYNGYTSTGVFPIEGGASPIPGLEAYRVNVSVVSQALGTNLKSTVPASASLRVTVTVTDPSSANIALTGYRIAYE